MTIKIVNCVENTEGHNYTTTVIREPSRGKSGKRMNYGIFGHHVAKVAKG